MFQIVGLIKELENDYSLPCPHVGKYFFHFLPDTGSAFSPRSSTHQPHTFLSAYLMPFCQPASRQAVFSEVTHAQLSECALMTKVFSGADLSPPPPTPTHNQV